VVSAAIARFGAIDILVNCAAIAPYRPLGQMDAAFVRSILDTNVGGLVMMTEAALPHLPSPGGRIINIASALAYRPIPTSSVYAASKAAVITLTHAFAKELGPKGITVNAVAPGVIRTDMTATILKERGDQILAMTPLARIGEPDDISGIVTFLASPEAGWITGRTIVADGGVS
jgi:3-oxoacyl-[acyl-carrier protein] reductase